jgi:predicted deacylase
MLFQLRLPAILLALPVLAIGADITVGTATAGPGRSAAGVIKIPAGLDAAIDIPVIIVNGAKPGPILVIVAGAHGTEYASIIALEQLAPATDPAAMSGALIILPLLNIASFTQKVPHINPVDGKGLNRSYPGKADGTQTDRISAAVAGVIDKADYVIDLHGGDIDENLRRYSYWPVTGKADLDAKSKAMALAFGLDHIIIQKGAPNPTAISLSRLATDRNKPTLIAEAGRAGTVEAGDVKALIDGTHNVMSELKMLPGSAGPPVQNPVWIGDITTVRGDKDGIFYPLVVPEAYVPKGAVIGYITDYTGRDRLDVHSPISGIVVYVCSVPSMKKGDTVANIGEIAQAPQ